MEGIIRFLITQEITSCGSSWRPLRDGHRVRTGAAAENGRHPDHTVVALAAALMVIVSKYGFNDVIVQDSVNLDPSRIASGVVSALGFLGAGIILNRKSGISGVTTAAGIWATLGIA